MRQAKFGTVLRHLHAMAAPKAMKELSDGQLLERYLAGKDEGAFTVIVQRHARLVWAVCRNVLQHDEDAEDALQATFLVLATKGCSIKKAQLLASWLHGVAFRTAMMAKRSAAVRRAHEKARREMAEQAKSAVTDSQAAWKELLGVLDAEVRRLPEKYSAPFILCCLEGRSGPEAARVLGWKQGTVDGRLSQARKLLGQRLLRRGIDLGLVLGGLAVSYRAAPAAGIVRLAVSVLQDADLLAAGQAAAGTGSARAVELALGVMKAMALSKVKIGVAVLLMVTLLTSSVGLAAWQNAGAGAPVAGKPTAGKSVVEHREVPKQAATQQPRVDSDGNPLPENALARMGSLAFFDGRTLDHVKVSPDGALLATTGLRTRLWDVKSGRELILPGDGIKSVGLESPFFAADKFMAVSFGFKEARIWDMRTNNEIARFAVSRPKVGIIGRECFALSPDGKTLVVQTLEPGLDRTMRFCDVGTGKVGEAVDLKGKEDTLVFAFSGDGKTLLIVETDSVKVWDVATQTQRIASPASAADFGACAAISFGGKVLATAPPGGNGVRLWDAKTLTELPPLLDQPQKPKGSNSWNLGLCFSPDGKQLAASYNGSPLVRLWDLASRKEIRQFQANDSFVREVAFFPDGKTLAGVGYSSVALWDVATGKRRDVGHACAISGLAFSPDGKTLVTGAGYFDTSIRLWDPATGQQKQEWSGHTSGIEDLALSRDGKHLATSSQDKSIRIWDFRTGKELHRLQLKNGRATALVFAPDSKSLYEIGREHCVQIWDVTTGKELGGFEIPGGRSMSRLAFSPDGKMLATRETGVTLWDLASQKVLREFGNADERISSFSFSPDGKFMCTTGHDSKIRIRKTVTARVVRVFSDPPPPRFTNPHWFVSVAYSPDGRTLAAGQEDGMVRVWELATWQERARFDGHRSSVLRLSFSPDGAMLASGGDDRTVMVWDVTGQGAARAKGKTLADSKRLNAIWDALASPDALKGYGAIKEMLAVGTTAVAFLNKRLSVVEAADDKHMANLITQLDSNNFAQREKAVRELKELGDRAEYTLEAVLAGQPSLELRRRAEGLLELLELTRSPKWLRALRAIEVLEHIGTPDARAVLERLAQGGPRVRLTQEAKASVLRLKQWAK